MCGRFEQSGTRRCYAAALGADTSVDKDWLGDHEGRYNIFPTLCPCKSTCLTELPDGSGIVEKADAMRNLKKDQLVIRGDEELSGLTENPCGVFHSLTCENGSVSPIEDRGY